MKLGPPGLISHMWGVTLPNSSNNSTGISKPQSLAMAGMCRTVLVDPPSAKSTRMAFSNAFDVII